MSFLTGITFLIPLALFTVILFYLSKFIPKEGIQLPIFLMIAGDGILVAIWYFGLIELVDTVKEFKIGIGLSFATAAFGRSIYFMVMNKEV